MNIAVLHVNPSSINSNSPTMRIARFVAEHLDAEFIYNFETAISNKDKRFDILFVKFGMVKFCEYREIIFKIYERAKRVINLENDYTFKPDKRFLESNSHYEVWSSVTGRDVYMDWNMISWSPIPVLKKPLIQGLFYYGAFREDREADFWKYFAGARYQVLMSTYRGQKLFQRINKNIKFYSPLKSMSQLCLFQSTLYIEDKTSHNLYCSPANRFYECLGAGVPIFFDISALSTFDRAKIDISKWLVSSQRDILMLLKSSLKIQAEQRAELFKDYGRIAQNNFNKIVRKFL